MLFDRLWTARHCIIWRARSSLVCYTILGKDSVRNVQATFIPQLFHEPIDKLFRIIHGADSRKMDYSRTEFADLVRLFINSRLHASVTFDIGCK